MHKSWKLNLNLFTLLLLSLNSNAAEVDYGVRLALTHQDNVNLEPVPEESAFSKSIKGKVTLKEDAANFTADVVASLESINYSDDKALDENNGELFAELLWVIKPKQFEWYLSDKYTQSAIDLFDALSPTNKQNINAFITGPNYLVRFDNKNTIRLEGRLSDNSFEKTTNNNRLSGSVIRVYGVNANLNFGLNYSAEKTDYEDEINNSNNERDDFFFYLNYKKGLNTLNLEAGKINNNNDNGDEVDLSRYLFSLQNQRTRTSNVRIVYENSLSDTGAELLSAEELVAIDNDTLIVTSNDIFVKENFRFIYNKQTTFGDLSLTVGKSYNDYTIQQSNDHKVESVNISSITGFTERSSLEFKAGYEEMSFDDASVNRVDEDIKYSLFYTFRAKRNYNLRFDAVSLARKSTNAEENYDDLKLMVAIEYVSR